MASELELYDARLSYLRFSGGEAEIHFSYACIHITKGRSRRDSGNSWSQEAVLLLKGAQLDRPLPQLPNTIVAGHLELQGDRHELIPLPFAHHGPARLHLEFTDGSLLDLHGLDPVIRLEGDKVFLAGNC